MVRIAISRAAFEAIAATLPVGSTGYENAVNEKGERLIWLERRMLDKLNSYRLCGWRGKTPTDNPSRLAIDRLSGYDGWLTIEAFGRALPPLAAATRV